MLIKTIKGDFGVTMIKLVKNSKNKLLSIVYCLGLIIPFILFFGGFSIFTQNNDVLSFFIAFCGLVVLIKILVAYCKGKRIIFEIRSEKSVCVVLYFLAFLPRIIYLTIVKGKIQQVSDFALVVQHAQTADFTDRLQYYRNFGHKMLYSLLLHMLHLRSQTSILIFQCVLVSFAAVILFKIGKQLGKSYAGIIAAVIFSLWPSLFVYTSVVSEEHMALVLLVAIIYLLTRINGYIENEGNVKYYRELISVIGTGIMLGLVSFFKDWGAIVLVAILICSIYLAMTYRKLKRNLVLLVSIIIIFGTRFITQNVVSYIEEVQLGGLSVNNGIVAMQMYETLDPNGSGGYDSDKCREYFSLVEEADYNFREAQSKALHILSEKILTNVNKMPGLIYKKGIEAYSSNRDMMTWAFVILDDDSKVNYVPIFKKMVRFDMIVFNSVVLLLLLGACIVMYLPHDIYFILLIILGGGIAGLLVEPQGRYKYSIEAIWCIPVAFAACWLFNRFCEKRNGVSSRKKTGHKNR